ncbi:MAG: hypothetical protein Q7J25_12650 [Vicinamibacterales bacterium]|nr:hypothetical protein [Vicinamibacterales bacterium]
MPERKRPQTPQLLQRLSENGERALHLLGLSEEDQNFVRVHVHTHEVLPNQLPKKSLAGTHRRLKKIIGELEELTFTHDGIRLSPPGGAFPELADAIAACRALERLLGEHLKTRQRRKPWDPMWLAILCAFVQWRTGRPHDAEVADIWLELDQPDESRTPDAVRVFRRRHAAEIRVAQVILARPITLSTPPTF